MNSDSWTRPTIFELYFMLQLISKTELSILYTRVARDDAVYDRADL